MYTSPTLVIKEINIIHKGEPIKIIASLVKNKLWIHLKGTTYIIDNPHSIQLGKKKPTHKKKNHFEKYLYSPMPSKVSQILVKKGDLCQSNQVLLILNSMKMEYTLKAKSKCKVQQILVKTGDVVSVDQKLVIFQASPG